MEPNKNQTESPFSSQTNADQTNPFTGDLKGEFTSEFGTNTNAVSQIFNNNGFNSQSRTKMVVGIVALVSLLAGGFFYIQSQDSEAQQEDTVLDPQEIGEEDIAEGDDELQQEQVEAENGKDTEATASEENILAEDAPAPSATADSASEMIATKTAPRARSSARSSSRSFGSTATMGQSGSISVASPIGGADASYNESMAAPRFSWQGNADKIMFSRSASMRPVYRWADVTGRNSYEFQGVFPGNWYWQLQGPDGMSDIKSFTISPPSRRQISIIEPQSGAALSGNGGFVAWSSADKVARYQVQFKTPDMSWANPTYRYGTVGTKVAVSGISPGTYDMRVGAFSEVSGRWEWHVMKGIAVQ